jgi:hypothetical protein
MANKININQKYNSNLARIFSNAVISELINDKPRYLPEILTLSGFYTLLNDQWKVKDLFDTVYNYLSKFYRNEYIYKNVITNKILLGKHSLNTSFMILEFRVSDCKADTVIINGTSNVYEIKTELDSTDRLSKQIEAYKKVFDKINVIASSSQISKIEKTMNESVGIMELTPRNTIKTIREASSRKHLVEQGVIFDSLRKNEYLSIIQERFGFIPEVPNTQIHSKCKSLFLTLSPNEAHDLMVEALKTRGNSSILKEFINSIPYSLKAFALNSRLNKADKNRLLDLLDKPCGWLLNPATH